jgi:hypothetical protein
MNHLCPAGLMALVLSWWTQSRGAELQEAQQVLNPAKLAAIRSVSQYVLAAKHGAPSDDGGDATQLDRLRQSVDPLIAAERDANSSETNGSQAQDDEKRPCRRSHSES